MAKAQIPPLVLDAFRAAGIPTEALKYVSVQMVTDTNRQLDYFVKVTSSDDTAARFKGESESLRALGKAAPDLVPKLFQNYVCHGEAVMISECFTLSYMPPESESELGRQLAKMHDPNNLGSRSPNGMYGFHVPTHCGETEQNNQWESDWMVFFRDRRVRSLIDRIHDPKIKELGEILCDLVVPFLLSNFEPKPQPVIVHGDLWSGNVSLNKKTGQPILFDPSSSYSHHEFELGIMQMFGGMSEAFLSDYHRHLPKSEPHHQERIRLYELYHHLNHTLLFGGGYRSGAIKIMKELIAFVENAPAL